MTKSPQRARDASKPKSATRQPKNKKRTSEPLKPDEGRVRKIDISPEEFFKAWSRKEKEALIEVLIDTLDAEAGDTDLEETGDDEPSLGFQAGDIFVGRGCESGGSWHDDREADDGDDEPSLGSVEDHPNGYYDGSDVSGHRRSQENWASGNSDDREGDEHDGREPECEDEGAQCDDEGDCSDSGIGDHDGLMEQCAGHRAVNRHYAGAGRSEYVA